MKDKHYLICKADTKAQRADGVINFVLTSLNVDRDSEVVVPSGGDFENYKKNPVFLWAHKRDLPPIGKVLPDTIQQTDDKVTADVQFDLKDKFAKMIYQKYKDEYLNAGSIGFLPTEAGKPIFPEQQWDTWLKWELLEFSGVPVPANPMALSNKVLEEDKEKFGEEVVRSFETMVKYVSGIETEKDIEKYNSDEALKVYYDQLINSEEEDNDDVPDDDIDKTIPGEDEDKGKIEDKDDIEIPNYTKQLTDINDRIDDMQAHLIELRCFVDPKYASEYFLSNYDLTKWENVAEAMNDLYDLNLSAKAFEITYKILSAEYEKHGKKVPEIESHVESPDDLDMLTQIMENDKAFDSLVTEIVQILKQEN